MSITSPINVSRIKKYGIKLSLAMGILIVGAVSLGIVREAFGNGFIHGIGLVLLISSLFSIFNFRLWFWSYRSLYIVSITFAALSLLYAGVIIYQSNNCKSSAAEYGNVTSRNALQAACNNGDRAVDVATRDCLFDALSGIEASSIAEIIINLCYENPHSQAFTATSRRIQLTGPGGHLGIYDDSNIGLDDDEIAPGVRLNGRPDPRRYLDQYRAKAPDPAPVSAEPERQDSSINVGENMPLFKEYDVIYSALLSSELDPIWAQSKREVIIENLKEELRAY
jgi:hypothetical protein